MLMNQTRSAPPGNQLPRVAVRGPWAALVGLLLLVGLPACDGVPGQDSEVPTVSITEPLGGAVVSGTVDVVVEASDDIGVESVSLEVDGAGLGTSSTAPYRFDWDTTAGPNGSHVLRATASDAVGNVSEVLAVVEVDNGGLPLDAVSIINPVDGSTVCGAITVTAVAIPDIIQVVLAVDGSPLATDSEAPFEATWNTSSTAAGQHLVSAVGTTAEGDEAQDTVTVTVEGDDGDCDNLPTVAITTPEPDSFVDGLVAVEAIASDDKGVRRVEFFIDGGMFFSDDSIPYASELDTTLFDEGPHGLRAVAYDTADQTNQANVTVTIDRSPPAVSFASPASNALIGGLADVQVDASDEYGVAAVELFVDSVSVGLDESAPFSWAVDTSPLEPGAVELLAHATDNAGHLATATREVRVDQPPEVSIVSPTSTVSEAITVISASASDDLGVVSVEFLVDGSTVGIAMRTRTALTRARATARTWTRRSTQAFGRTLATVSTRIATVTMEPR